MLFASSINAGVIANYSFDDGDLATGPDTFAIFAKAKGRVELASDIRHSGSRSVLISDEKGDGDFPEIQGYFDQIATGAVHFRFAMLIATPNETLNIALAGPSWFSLEKDGIAFWLKTDDGWLVHVSDSMPKKLLRVQPFTWYIVDLQYRAGEGKYDLTISQEGIRDPVVALKDVPNATSQPSAINMYSFVGDVHEDATSPRYYIDDVLLATNDASPSPKFAAPGRRRLFVDAWRDAAREAINRRGCPPIVALSDLAARDVAQLQERIVVWQSPCEALERGEFAEALRMFDEESERWRDARAPRLGGIIALARLKRWEEAEMRWASLAPLLRDDIRYGTMAALVGSHRESWEDAESWLREPAESLADGFRNASVRRLWAGGDDAIDLLRRDDPQHWREHLEKKLIVEEYYFVLLWRKEYTTAGRYATRVAAQLAKAGADGAWWRERAGDAELLAGDLVAARRDYESCNAIAKLSDVAYLSGDAAAERKYREQLFGRWSP